MHILVTGGAGYIGSHTIIELLNNGHSVVVVDNLCNSNIKALQRVELITNASIPFYDCDIREQEKIELIFEEHVFDAIIHFAGLKSVSESLADPIRYYDNNLSSTIILLEMMKKFNVRKLIFSSSATVYGTPENLPLTEASRTGLGITNPYGQTKYMIEQILHDTSHTDPALEITILRYFNPVGAHGSGQIGEDPNGPPNNLLPYISQVAISRRKKLYIYGNDYDTKDGTGIRDYIHVVDLARGHVAALTHSQKGNTVYNLCTGQGISVLELVAIFSRVSGKKIPFEFIGRRLGDVAACYASPKKANKELDWFAKRSIEDACRDSWRWQLQNPNGY